MRILLDENMNPRLRRFFPEHQFETVTTIGWRGKKNGELLKLILNESFGAFITFDHGIPFQNNLSNYTIPIIILQPRTTKRLMC